MIELGDAGPVDASENTAHIIEALKRELRAVEIPTDDPRFQELLTRQANGSLTYSERDELNWFIEQGTRAVV